MKEPSGQPGGSFYYWFSITLVQEPVSYAADIKPLFHERDRDSMTFAFDLWSFDDVSDNADTILKRLQAGTMPCYGAWPKDNVGLFKRWVDGGKRP